MNIDDFLAKRVRALRKERGYALETLAELSGVSRSMISLIERAETSPTAAVLNKLADALGVTLASLFAEQAGSAPSPLSRFAEQRVWKDPASGYVRRHVSPDGFAAPIEVVDVRFPPGETVAFDTMVRNIETHQQVWVLDGEMTVTVDDAAFHLQKGDCLAMTLGRRIVFHNPTAKQARYAVVLTTTSGKGRQS